MEEKTLIRSELYDIAKFRKMCIITGVVLFAMVYLGDFWRSYTIFDEGENIIACFLDHISYSFRYLSNILYYYGALGLAFYVPAGIGILAYAWLSKVELIVTDKRVYGTAAFGKRVDLPFDSISAIGTGWPKGIAVATSSGKISFLAIKNCDEIHDVLSKLLVERQGQQKPAVQTTIKQEIPQSNADELKKYKELLDSGIISQEEFDAKKKQLLGL